MKLTELKNQIDEALKLHDDYDVKILSEHFDKLDIEDCGIDRYRFNFNIEVDIPIEYYGCDGYHIEEDEYMVYCEKCAIYYPSELDCPSCELKELKK